MNLKEREREREGIICNWSVSTVRRSINLVSIMLSPATETHHITVRKICP